MQTYQTIITKLCIIISWNWLLASCGSNIYEKYNKASYEDLAVIELEKQNPQKAIAILEKALTKYPNNVVYISLLSAAYAQKHGVDMLDIILHMAQNQPTSNPSDNALTMLWMYLPEATAENIAGIKYSLDLLISIDEAQRRDCDNFKLSILAIIYSSISLKAFDLNQDGILSVNELSNLTLEQAKNIVGSILEAALSITSISVFNEGNSEAASNLITNIYNQLNTQPGSNELQQLTNFLTN